VELITTYANIPLTFHKGEGRGLMVVYPGLHYRPAHPLLYYTRKSALYLGWDVLEMEYDLNVVPKGRRGEWLEEVAELSLNWAAERAPRLVLAGKSLGTAMLALAPIKKLSIPWGRIWITPLIQRTTIYQAMKKETRGLAVAGGRDRYIPKDRWQSLAHPGLRQVWIEEADHRLEVADPLVSLEYLKRYTQELNKFLQVLY